jgi:hypothetical protein
LDLKKAIHVDQVNEDLFAFCRAHT